MVSASGDRGGLHGNHFDVAILLLRIERLAVGMIRRPIGVGVI